MTKVVHCKKEQYDVYIGRECYGLPSSIWGNPFKIGPDGTREQVIEKYRKYILDKPELLQQLESLRGKTLGCWCSPQHCHGDVLAELLEQEASQSLGQCVVCGGQATVASPSGRSDSVYCKSHGKCSRCGGSVKKFVSHPNFTNYLCPCVIACYEHEETKNAKQVALF
jgi:uncharacterized protein DUF4326